ncbi:MAG: 4-hydroxy-tetrahydrodipicolinate synthase [Bacteroidota bacterium]|nr:4-hydroxy-tetrahydrodipicolinate synthase [Bacteroidota bacterium]
MKFKGLGVAVITPFNKKLELDRNALKKIIENLVSNGADFLVMLGTTAESVTLSKEEKLEVIQIAKEINKGKLPIVVGIGGNNTRQIVTEIEKFNFTGIDGILSVSPYYNKPNQNGIYEHYKSIAKKCPVPVILYNVPGRTGSNITAQTTLKLAKDFENIVAIKEASGDFSQIMEIIDKKSDDFTVISGDDAITLPLFSIGVEGVISVIGNAFPKEFSSMINAFNNNDNTVAKKNHYNLIEFIKLIFAEGNPSGIKSLLSLKEYCEKHVRQPLYPLSEKITLKLKELIEISKAQ